MDSLTRRVREGFATLFRDFLPQMDIQRQVMCIIPLWPGTSTLDGWIYSMD
jgi:hypothetical protein